MNISYNQLKKLVFEQVQKNKKRASLHEGSAFTPKMLYSLEFPSEAYISFLEKNAQSSKFKEMLEKAASDMRQQDFSMYETVRLIPIPQGLNEKGEWKEKDSFFHFDNIKLIPYDKGQFVPNKGVIISTQALFEIDYMRQNFYKWFFHIAGYPITKLPKA